MNKIADSYDEREIDEMLAFLTRMVDEAKAKAGAHEITSIYNLPVN
jgi:hypothetical protein